MPDEGERDEAAKEGAAFEPDVLNPTELLPHPDGTAALFSPAVPKNELATAPEHDLHPTEGAMSDVIALSDILNEAIAAVSQREAPVNPDNIRVPTLKEVLPKLDGIKMGEDVLVRLGVRMASAKAVEDNLICSSPDMSQFLEIARAFYADTKIFDDVVQKVRNELADRRDFDKSSTIKGFTVGMLLSIIWIISQYPGEINHDYLLAVGKWFIEGTMGGGAVGLVADGINAQLYKRENGKSFLYEMAVFISDALKQAEGSAANDKSRRKEVLIEAAKIVAARIQTKLSTIGVLQLDRHILVAEDMK